MHGALSLPPSHCLWSLFHEDLYNQCRRGRRRHRTGHSAWRGMRPIHPAEGRRDDRHHRSNQRQGVQPWHDLEASPRKPEGTSPHLPQPSSPAGSDQEDGHRPDQPVVRHESHNKSGGKGHLLPRPEHILTVRCVAFPKRFSWQPSRKNRPSIPSEQDPYSRPHGQHIQ